MTEAGNNLSYQAPERPWYSMHHSFLIGSWNEHGLRVVQADDETPVLLLRDPIEIGRFIAALEAVRIENADRSFADD